MDMNIELLEDFVHYCKEHPEQRFWQALRNWSGASFVHITLPSATSPMDRYYFEGKNS